MTLHRGKGIIKMEHTELMEQNGALPGEREEERLSLLAVNIRARKQQVARDNLLAAIDIGRWLTEAKVMVPHGEWGEWLKREVDYSQSTAQNLMRIYRECGDEQESLFGPSKAQALGDLSPTKVLQLLTLPEGPERDEFMETHDVAAMSSRELDRALKELDEAKKAAEQAKAEQSAAEQARQKMEQDMAMANERIEGLNAEVEEQSAKAREAQEESARLTAELEELRSRPVEVAVEVDAAAVEAARKEAEAAMQAKLDRAKKAQAKAEEARKAAEDAKARAQRELEQARADAQAALEKVVAEGQAVRERAEKAEKRAAMAGNEDMALFRTLFDQVQETVNKMSGVLMKFRSKNPPVAEKLSEALLALSEKVKEAAEG